VAAFQEVMGPPGHQPDLLEAVTAVATPEYPLLRVDAVRGQVDAWARASRACVASLAEVPRTPALLAGVCHVLFKETGLRGDTGTYSDPRNSFLNEVIARRLGLPITLTVLFVEVARRVGLEAHGVGFPGHFLARVADRDDPGTFVIVDGFSGGTILGMADLQGLLTRAVGEDALLTEEMLSPVPVRQVVARVLRNLKAAYTLAEDFGRALLAQERLLLLDPDDPGQVRDHGLLLARTDEPGAAAAQLERYLTLEPNPADGAEMHRTLEVLRRYVRNVQ
jgi:regulator of sirC expression with transglutaminase-like and TPR domain